MHDLSGFAKTQEDGGTLYVHFSLEPLPDKKQSLAAGHPVMVDTECITIASPGDKDNIVGPRPVLETDRRRFPAQYKAFTAGEKEQHVGLPLKEWPLITRATAANLAYFRVHTVEQLAGISDSNLSALGPGHQGLREKARLYVEQAKGNAPILQLQAENTELKSLVETLSKQVKELGDRVESAQKAKAK